MTMVLTATSRMGLVETTDLSSKILDMLGMLTAHPSDKDINEKIHARVEALNSLPEIRRNFTFEVKGRMKKNGQK